MRTIFPQPVGFQDALFNANATQLNGLRHVNRPRSLVYVFVELVKGGWIYVDLAISFRGPVIYRRPPFSWQQTVGAE